MERDERLLGVGPLVAILGFVELLAQHLELRDALVSKVKTMLKGQNSQDGTTEMHESFI